MDTIYNEKEKIWYGPKPMVPLFNPDCSVGRLLHTMMKLKPKAIALQSDSEGTGCTYEQLLIDSIRIAQYLEKFYFSQEDIVGMISDQQMYFTHVYLACWFNGLCVHPVAPSHEQAVVTHIFGITRPKIIFCQGKYYRKAKTTCAELKLNTLIYTMDDHIHGVTKIMDLLQPTGTEELYVPKELKKGRDQNVAILNSSGSTGLPKAVCISNHSLLNLCRPSEDDVIFVFSPLDWLGCMTFSIMSIIVGAKRLISTRPCTPEYYLKLIEKYKITNILIMPSLIARIIKLDAIKYADISSLRQVSIGGSIMSAELHRNVCELFKDNKHIKICNGYAITEIGGVITLNYDVDKPGSVGKLRENYKIKLINDNGEQVGVGTSGEVLVNKKYNWNGYFNNPEATLDARDTEGWYHTGDLGYFDEDGYLYLIDRAKDILKYCGIHYSPQEIEEVIAELPEVVEVCVFGNTNETEGDRAAAAIVKREGSRLTAAVVIQYVADKFEVEWKRLHGGVFFFDSLPTTSNGKVSRRGVRDMLLGQRW